MVIAIDRQKTQCYYPKSSSANKTTMAFRALFPRKKQSSEYGFVRTPSSRMSTIKVHKNKIMIAGIALLFLVAVGFWITRESSNGITGAVAGVSDNRPDAGQASATLSLNKELAFPLKNEKNESVGQFKYIVENAELRKEIIVKGQRATSVKGRIFLVINLKVNNDTNNKLALNTRDYIRLMVNDNDKELLAPDVHNDPVEIQAISTKYTRVAFPINETDKNLRLRLGEISGEKQTVDLVF